VISNILTQKREVGEEMPPAPALGCQVFPKIDKN